MCDRLRELARAVGFRVYPETEGWDLLLVRPGDGFQVGIQAKLRPNVEVLYQTIRGSEYLRKGPDVRAIAVPEATAAIVEVARALRVLVLEVSILDLASSSPERRHWESTRLDSRIERAPVWETSGRCWVPPIESDLPAGTPAPITLSRWKVATAKICAVLRDEGSITAERLRELGGNPSTWRAWLDPIAGTKPRRYQTRILTSFDGTQRPIKLPDEDFRELAAQIVAAG